MNGVPVTRPTVLIFTEKLLPISETFIETQALHLSCFVPRYIGLGRVVPSLELPADSILLTSKHSTAAKIRQNVYRRVGLAPRFYRCAASAGASLVHAHFASGGRAALPLASRLRIPLIVTLHGSDVTTRINFRQRYKDLWRKASTFVCVSEFIRRRAADAGFPEEKLRVLYIGVDRGVFRPQTEPRNRQLVLFVGRLVEKKGCAFMLQAIANVQRRHFSVEAVVIGDGPLRSSLEALAKRLGIQCLFLGVQPKTVVRKWLSAARVLCAPSVTASNGDSEGAPIVILEAQAMGVPVVSTYHAGIPEVVVDGRTGLLAPERDSTTLGDHILRLLEDEHFWQECSESGADWIQHKFDVKVQTGHLENVYTEVCEST